MRDVCLTDNQKLNLLKTATNKSEPVFCITRENVQCEAIDKLGRLLTDDEIEIVTDKLEWGIGESLSIVYDAAFEKMR